jgi:dTDP-4-dehydrorhamnose reductase
MKIAIIGADGQLGYDLCRVIDKSEQIPLTIKDIDITDANQCEAVLSKYSPNIVINTAAYNKVDEAEQDQNAANLINADGAKNIARVCKKLSAVMVHFSTDYVYDGAKKTPYVEADIPDPRSVYGKSKLTGESLVRENTGKYFIVRTAGLFGVAGCMGKGGGNFVEAILKKAKTGEELKVVEDEIFSPTYTVDLAKKLNELIRTEHFGLYHMTNAGQCSWYEFAEKILEYSRLKTKLVRIKVAELKALAPRPKYSVLDNYNLRKIGLKDMRSWPEALKDYLAER